MPELPEVETVRRTLLQAIGGSRLLAPAVLRPDVIDGPGSASALLGDGVVDRIERHGKQLAIVTRDGRALGAHLGMTGRLSVCAPGETRPAHTHVEWPVVLRGLRRPTLALRFIDPRRFGGLWTFDSLEALRAARWSGLGPDALGIMPKALHRACRTARAIKAALLDQSTIAGLGNIYADESLHLARIHPRTPGAAITFDRLSRLAEAIDSTLRDAIDAGGSTLADSQYVDARGVSGVFQTRHRVYARANLPCLTCDRPLRSTVVAGRTTVWCPACQPIRRSGRRDRSGGPAACQTQREGLSTGFAHC